MALTKVRNQMIEGATVNVLDFGAVGDGITDDSAAVQAALTFAVDNEKELYFPEGSFLFGSTVTVGNAAGQSDNPITICGAGRGTILKATATLANGLIRIEGPNGAIDAQRHYGRVMVKDLRFNGPGRYALSPAGLGLSFYGVQGIYLDNVHALGFSEGVKFHNCDLVTMVGCQLQANTTGVATENSGYALGGQLNSFTMVGCWVNNNTQYGVDYHGGLKPTFIGNNFSANGNSLNISNTAEAGATTQTPTITDNYFESDTGSWVILGGAAGIVSGGNVSDNTALVTVGTTAITVGNVQNTASGVPVRIYDNNQSSSGAFTEITQATSVVKADYRNGYLQVVPAFQAVYVSNASNLTGDSPTPVTLVYDTERFDTLGNYDLGTGKFTAPFDGYYEFNWSTRFFNVTSMNVIEIVLQISGGSDYDMSWLNNAQGLITGAAASFTLSGSVIVYMNATETAEITIAGEGEASTVVGVGGGNRTWFSGKMVSS
jgi:hypothetical protein